MKKVYIDGGYGTTGLIVKNKLKNHNYIDLLEIDENHKKDPKKRLEKISESDLTFLCLPDKASIDIMKACEDIATVIVDTSTAFRTCSKWQYGFAELFDFRDRIARSKRVSNPGCHASGFIALVSPLVENNIIKKSEKLSAISISGYSGGGKKMISQYESHGNIANNPRLQVFDWGNIELLDSARLYALNQSHKHLPEITKYSNLFYAPVFMPFVDNFFSGMEVVVPLHKDQINGSVEDIKSVYKSTYNTNIVTFVDNLDTDGFVAASRISGYDNMQISVFGNDERLLLVSSYDNLGKGAAGAAIQNMNIIFGFPEHTGLNIMQ